MIFTRKIMQDLFMNCCQDLHKILMQETCLILHPRTCTILHDLYKVILHDYGRSCMVLRYHLAWLWLILHGLTLPSCMIMADLAWSYVIVLNDCLLAWLRKILHGLTLTLSPRKQILISGCARRGRCFCVTRVTPKAAWQRNSKWNLDQTKAQGLGKLPNKRNTVTSSSIDLGETQH